LTHSGRREPPGPLLLKFEGTAADNQTGVLAL
jgi:hypothetical protein